MLSAVDPDLGIEHKKTNFDSSWLLLGTVIR